MMMSKLVSNLLTVQAIIAILPILASCEAVPNLRTTAVSQPAGERWAILVGVGDYLLSTVDTRYADDDAIELALQLEPIFGRDHIKLLVNSEATKSHLQNAIYEWLEPQENKEDTVLVFLAGHGNSELFQLRGSGKNQSIENFYPQELSVWLNILESSNIALIMDFCGSGGFSEAILDFRGVAIAGCIGNEKCWQESAYGHGVFSYYLLESFNQLPAVDTNNDLKITMEELFEQVYSQVEIEYQKFPPPSSQNPYIQDNFDGELVLFDYLTADNNVRP